ncbi:MAG: fluoride efflux transporter CrcB [Planctomycetota bacterium]|nr:fluoride efflux transporter CrcB [Planctomycetota bacterium]
MLNLLLVFLGGGLGSAARYGVALLTPTQPGHFPLATLLVNLAGCFAAGIVLARLVPTFAANHPARLLIAVGFLGGLTTFSAFSLETVALLRDAKTNLALVNVAANVLGSLTAAWFGYMLATARPVL